MFKFLILLTIPLLLISCNELSEKEIENKLAELELLKLVNAHLEEDIEGLRQNMDAKMALPENGKKHKPIINKINAIDSIINSKIDIVQNCSNYKQLNPTLSTLTRNILDIINSDTTQYILLNGKNYFDSSVAYNFNLYKNDIIRFDNQNNRLLYNIKSPTELELQEIKLLLTSELLLLNKRSIKYLSQKMFNERSYRHNKLFLSLQIENTKFKPRELVEFNVTPTSPFLSNYSLFNYTLDDSLTFTRSHINKYTIDSILVPTNKLGAHEIKINKYIHGKLPNLKLIYKYEVVE